ncbi:MAG: flagellin FliC3 [Lachnoclostridium sp.]|nr:flagellin FliC3 [Lachnospira sp.]MCM1247992.1 flagellin FliC3 [Lachnoclostridium sp.]
MRINYNVSAMLSNNSLANNDSRLAASLERLSSGLKINHAKDNPAGLAMAKRMNAQIVGLSTASENANDGISVIEIADGALTEVADMLQRMNELCVKASTGTLGEDDRKTIQDEITQLKEEIDRVADTTEFNGQKLLNGEFERKGYCNEADIRVSYCSVELPAGKYKIGTLQKDPLQFVPAAPTPDGYNDFPIGNPGYTTEIKDDLLTIKGDNGFEMQLDMTDAGTAAYTDVEVEIMDIGSLRLQVGANEGQTLEVSIPAMTARNMGIEKLDVSTADGAKYGIEQVKGAIQFVSRIRGRLGAYQNRLESTVNSLDITNENMTAAYSRIMDVDMADEMIQYTTNQVLTQAGTSMLAQANERPSQVLQLLQ